MSRQTAHLLEAFEALPESEKRIFTAEFMRRTFPFDSGPLEDEETSLAGDELLAWSRVRSGFVTGHFDRSLGRRQVFGTPSRERICV